MKKMNKINLVASLFNELQFLDLVNKKLITSTINCGDPHYLKKTLKIIYLFDLFNKDNMDFIVSF